jgi:endonuclease/exonuclease/phosphatase family metal-dependent hydrolase
MTIITTTAHAESISIMSYNVENLFDTTHDLGKEDYTYLPKKIKDNSTEIQNYCKQLSKQSYIKSCLNLDWNKDILNRKFKNIARVIKSFNFGQGPDVLVLEEVENQNVLNLLLNKELRRFGYRYAKLLEGEDSRGIDNGVISKYPITSSKMHKINLAGVAKKTRGILEVNIAVASKTVTVLANHWPSQGNPTQARAISAKTLNRIASQIDSELIVAVGDFNTVPSRDIPNPLTTITEKAFIDAETKARRMGSSLNPGTHWFAGHWGSLDKFYIHKSSLKSSFPLFFSFDIHTRDFLLGEKKWVDRETGEVTIYQGVPLRFNSQTGEGFSDHLPIVMSFYL